MLGGTLGAGLIIAAFAYPHPFFFAFGEVGSSERLGGIWLLTAAAVAVGIATSIVFGVRTPVRVSARAAPMTGDVESKTAAFGHSLGATFAIAAIAAWPTWIQGWPAIFALMLLTGLVGAALDGAIFAVKVVRVERRDHETLRSRGLLPALRGAFVATNAT